MGGKKRHQAQQAALASLGRVLSRRARSRCELCEAKEGLAPVLLRSSEEPDTDNTLLLCPSCKAAFQTGRIDDPSAFRFLETQVWSEEPDVQALAIRLLSVIELPWADVTRENLWIDEAVQARVDGLEP